MDGYDSASNFVQGMIHSRVYLQKFLIMPYKNLGKVDHTSFLSNEIAVFWDIILGLLPPIHFFQLGISILKNEVI